MKFGENISDGSRVILARMMQVLMDRRTGTQNFRRNNIIPSPLFVQGIKMYRLYKQEAHGPRFTHLSDIATADMQMLCNIFPILSSQLMKISSFEQFLVLKKNIWA